jgi:hypothetical protein
VFILQSAGRPDMATLSGGECTLPPVDTGWTRHGTTGRSCNVYIHYLSSDWPRNLELIEMPNGLQAFRGSVQPTKQAALACLHSAESLL